MRRWRTTRQGWTRALRRMGLWSARGRGRRGLNAARLAGLGTLALLVLVLAMQGCPPPSEPTPTVEAPVRLEGVPSLRVLVASGESIRIATTGGYRILADRELMATSLAAMGETQLTRRGLTWSVQQAAYRADKLTLQTVGRSFIRIGGTSYRGSVVFHPDPARGILTVNHVDLESYLAGVLARELYASWRFTTYQAQAIVARTYALYESATVGKGRPYDLLDDQSSQVYGGFSAETDKAWEAVRDTHGIVLATGPAGHEKIFRAHYSSCCGGTVNNVCVLYGPKVASGPLVGGQTCADCQGSTRYRWPPVTVSKDAVYRALAKVYPLVAALNRITGVEVAEEMNGRPVWINVVAPGGQKVRLRAEDLRLALLRDGAASAKELYSMNCHIRDIPGAVVFEHGRGFGHGVGLCQWGAQGMAERGLSVERILTFYYPGARLFRAY